MTTTFVLMAGLPGTGKSTLAAALAETANGIVLSKDTIRAALFPGALTDYSEEQDDLCFRALLDAAIYVAEHRHPSHIFIDGRTFRKRRQIEAAIHAAQAAVCDWRILYLTCPEEVALARIADDRRSATHPAGNRDEHLYMESRSQFEPIESIDHPHLQVDTSAPLSECANRCMDYLADDRCTNSGD